MLKSVINFSFVYGNLQHWHVFCYFFLYSKYIASTLSNDINQRRHYPTIMVTLLPYSLSAIHLKFATSHDYILDAVLEMQCGVQYYENEMDFLGDDNITKCQLSF